MHAVLRKSLLVGLALASGNVGGLLLALVAILSGVLGMVHLGSPSRHPSHELLLSGALVGCTEAQLVEHIGKPAHGSRWI